MDFRQRAGERLQDRQERDLAAQQRRLADGARPRQMMIHMAAHQCGLLAHHGGHFGARLFAFIGQHGQRGLEGMRQIAHMGAGPGQHVGGVIQ